MAGAAKAGQLQGAELDAVACGSRAEFVTDSGVPLADLVASALDAEFLIARGYNPATKVLTPSPDDPQMGYRECARVGCVSIRQVTKHEGLCVRCHSLFRGRRASNPDLQLEQFFASDIRHHEVLCLLCRTDGHERAANHSDGLCNSCHHAAAKAGVSAAKYSSFADPRRTFGRCRCEGCDLWAQGRHGLCSLHYGRSRNAGGLCLEEFLVTQRRPAARPAHGVREVSFRGFSPELTDEILFAVQVSLLAGLQLPIYDLNLLIKSVREGQPWSLLLHPLNRVPKGVPKFVLARAHAEISLLSATREREFERPVWRVALWGCCSSPYLIQFSKISQGWLQDATKAVASKMLADGLSSKSTKDIVGAFTELSTSLREDARWDSVGACGAQAKATHLTRLRILQAEKQMSSKQRRGSLVDLRCGFTRARQAGLMDPGGVLESLQGSFELTAAEIPAKEARSDEYRDVPDAVIRRLLQPDALTALDAALDDGGQGRRLVQVQVAIGRRACEFGPVRFDCLETDPGGGYVLRLDLWKNGPKGFRLEITERVASLIKEQQRAVRARYPRIPEDKLALWPARRKNANGGRGGRSFYVNKVFEAWSITLPAAELLDARGNLFPPEDIRCHPLRHSYAQRHVDAGEPVETLQALLGHDQITSTQIYYKISRRRRRMATERLDDFSLTVDGSTAAQKVRAATQPARVTAGIVPTALGACTEPGNVKAAGKACPVGGQCHGCAFAKTDVSFLPAWSSLLIRKKAYRAQGPKLADWAEQKLRPSEDEFDAIAAMIAIMNAKLDCLPVDQAERIRKATEQQRAIDMEFLIYGDHGSIPEGLLDLRVPFPTVEFDVPQ